MLGTFGSEGSESVNFTRANQSMLSQQPNQQHPWPASKFGNAFPSSISVAPYEVKDNAVEPENCSLDPHNHNTLFGVNIDSSGLLLPATMSSYATPSSGDADMASMPLGASGFYGCIQDSSELLHGSSSAGQVDPPTPTRPFVKV